MKSSLHVCAQSLSCVWLFVTPWTVVRQAPLSMGFPRQEYWGELPFPPPGDLPNSRIKTASPVSQADSLQLSHLGSPPVAYQWSEVAQSCPTLCDPMNCSLPGFSVHGIFQARVLEWVTIPFSRGSSRPRDWTQVSCIVGRRFTLWATREAQSIHRNL